jgi:hypothetical protein
MIKAIIIALTTVKCYQNKTNLRDLRNDTNKDNVVPIDGGFLYDITLDDGTVIKDLNYDGLQKYIKDHEDVGYDFKF